MSRQQQHHHVHVLLLVLAGLAATLTTADPLAELRPQVNTSSGMLRGLRVSGPQGVVVTQFLGVPYARPPTRSRRFRAPLPPTFKSNVIDAANYRSPCIQPRHLAEVIYPQLLRHHQNDQESEDCLFLNLFVPDKRGSAANGMPVMVWIAGEGYSFAISNQFDGSRLAYQGSVIVVTLNYRVGPLGFLSTGDDHVRGNMGLMDQLAAIRWVKNNIIAFGGDPSRITVFGRLSGAISVSALLVSPQSMENGKPLFQRAIMQSGVAGDSWTIDHNPLIGAKHLAHKVGCPKSPTAAMVRCLRKVPAHKINEVSLTTHSWRLVLDDTFLPDEPLNVIREGKHLPIPVMVGFTNDEGSMCWMAEYFKKRHYNAKILDDTLTEDDFDELLKDNIETNYGIHLPNITTAAAKAYKALNGTWRQKYLRFCGELYTQSKTLRLARLLSSQGSRVFLYEFTHRPEQSFFPDFIRAAQGDDILFSFGFIHDSVNNKTTEKERALSDAMMASWTNFAKKGTPNPMLHTTREWHSFSVDRKEFWEFGTSGNEKVKTQNHQMDNWRVDLWSQASQVARQQRLRTKTMKY